MTRSPYLKPNRLSDVIAAIQVMGSNPRAETHINKWIERFEENPEAEEAQRWEAVFREHPEFFKVYT